MKKAGGSKAAPKTNRQSQGRPAKSGSKSGRLTWAALVLFIAGAGLAGGFFWQSKSRLSAKQSIRRPAGTVTFSKDIAPIIFTHCSNCHRPGQSAPFDLLTYGQVKKRGQDIMAVTQRGYMPPWPPEPGFGDFVGDRHLTIDQIGLIQQWVAEGVIEGTTADLPALPKWSEGWQLGEPDLMVQMPQAYTLPASGKDVYRNFVIPIPTKVRRYVQAVELRPGNRSAHH